MKGSRGFFQRHDVLLFVFGVMIVIIIFSGLLIYYKIKGERVLTINSTIELSNYVYFFKGNDSNSVRISEALLSDDYLSSFPLHKDVLVKSPVSVVLDFKRPITDGSTLIVVRDKKGYNLGNVEIDPEGRTMRVSLKEDAPNGLYDVTYEACFDDGVCQDGFFQYIVDSNAHENYTKMKMRRDVVISNSNHTFDNAQVIVSKGTKITWVNDWNESMFIRTYPDQTSTYYPIMNSAEIKPGQSFSLFLEKEGVYPYAGVYEDSRVLGVIVVDSIAINSILK